MQPTLKPPSVRAEVWKRCVYSLRPAFAVLVTSSVFVFSGQTWFPAAVVGVIMSHIVTFGPFPVGIGARIGQSIIVGGAWVTIAAIPITSGTSRASDDVQRGILPPVVAVACFLLAFSLPGAAIVNLFTNVAATLNANRNWDDAGPAKSLLTMVVGVVIGIVCLMLPLPQPGSACPQPSSAAIGAFELVEHARTLAAALALQLEQSLQEGTDADLGPLKHLERKLSEAVAKLNQMQPIACSELKMALRGRDMAWLSAWIRRLVRQLKYFSLLTSLTVKGGELRGDDSFFARHGAMEARKLLHALGKAIVAPSEDGQMHSLEEEAADLERAHLSGRAAGVQDTLSRDGGSLTSEEAYHIIVSSSFFEALLALNACAVEEAAASTDPAEVSVWQQVRMLTSPPPFDFTEHGLRRALTLGISMGIATLWVSEPSLAESADGHGSWVGIAVCIIHQDTPDSSIRKAVNRIWGTLAAAGFALFLINTTAIEKRAAYAPCMVLWTFVCQFVAFLLPAYESYLASCASFTLALIVLDVSPDALDLGADLATLATTRAIMVIYGCVLYSIVQMVVSPVNVRTRFVAEVCAFLPLVSKYLAAVSSVFRKPASARDKHVEGSLLPASEVSVAAPIDERMAHASELALALRSSTASAKTLHSATSTAVYFGFLAPFPAKSFGALIDEQAHTALLAVVFNANMNNAQRLLETDHIGRDVVLVPQLFDEMLTLVSEHANACAEQLGALIDALQAPADAPLEMSPSVAVRTFRQYRHVKEQLLRVYADRFTHAYRAHAQKQDPAGGIGTDLLMTPPLSRAVGLSAYSLLGFCDSMVRLADHVAEISATHPQVERMAVRRNIRKCQESKAEPTAADAYGDSVKAAV